MIRSCLFVAWLLVSGSVLAEIETKVKPLVQPGSGIVTTDPLSVVLGLMFVVGLILLAAWLIRRTGALPMMTGQAIKVVAALSVGAREKVVLVDVGGKQILLGVAPGRISTLQTFDEPVIDTSNKNNTDFSSKFKQLLQQRKKA
jgi:flagellar protein FliO/FliZ